MIPALILIAFALCLPLCFAITAASRSGASNWLGYIVWALEAAAHRLIEAARWLRDFEAWRTARKAEAANA